MSLIVQRGARREYREEETGIEYFSVTQIRHLACDPYAGLDSQVIEAARHRGQRLHQRFWRVLAAREGLIAEPPILPDLEGYCKAMDAWARDHAVVPMLLETKGVNRKLGYAGTLDAKVLYSRRKTETLVDLKTGDEGPTDIMQLLAYDAIPEFKSKRLLDLYIRADGTYRERWVSALDRLTNWPVFLNALSLLRWRTTHCL